MANSTGIITIDFGVAPGSNEASVDVVGQTNISGTSKAEAFVMGDDSTVDHTTQDHRYLAMFAGFTCGTPIANTGFTIYARSLEKLTGQFKLRWVWTD